MCATALVTVQWVDRLVPLNVSEEIDDIDRAGEPGGAMKPSIDTCLVSSVSQYSSMMSVMFILDVVSVGSAVCCFGVDIA